MYIFSARYPKKIKESLEYGKSYISLRAGNWLAGEKGHVVHLHQCVSIIHANIKIYKTLRDVKRCKCKNIKRLFTVLLIH